MLSCLCGSFLLLLIDLIVGFWGGASGRRGCTVVATLLGCLAIIAVPLVLYVSVYYTLLFC